MATDKWAGRVLGYCAIGLFIVFTAKNFPNLDAQAQHALQAAEGLLLLAATFLGLSYYIGGSKVDLIILELRASLGKQAAGLSQGPT